MNNKFLGVQFAARGCVSDSPFSIGKQRCAESEFCLVGETNSQPGYSRPTLSCVQCTQSPTDPDCVTKTQAGLCVANILLGRPADECFTLNSAVNFIRDCLLTGGNEQLCKSNDCNRCTSNGCNSERYYVRKCHDCLKNNPNCAKNPELASLVDCIAQDENDNVCYRKEFEDGGVERGCIFQLEQEEQVQCLSQPSNCKTCAEETCNKKVDFQQCFICDSDTDPSCVTLQRMLPWLTCTNYLDQCGVMIDSDGSTARGCAKDLPQSNTKELCEPNRCNGQIYPQNRLSCHKCHGTAECALEQTVDTQEPCLRYQTDDNCYEAVDSNFLAHRGCISDPDALCGEYCNRCSTPNCNKNPSLSPPSLSCVSCTTSQPWCRWGFDASQAERCKTPIPIGTSEYCYVRAHKNGVARRGCTVDDENYCDGEDVENCITCDTVACNGQNTMYQSCVVCNSRDDPSCVLANYFPTPKTCLLPGREFLPYESRGCYTLRNNEGFVQRGCVVDLESEWRNRCEQQDRCEICFEQTCNTKRPPNSGQNLRVSMTILVLTLVMLIFQ